MNSKHKHKNFKQINNVQYKSNKFKAKNYKNLLQKKIVIKDKFHH